MKFTGRIAAVLCLASAPCSAETWSGTLVDSRCFDAVERNVNPTDTMIYVDRDVNLELSYCSPGAKTKLFAVIESDGTEIRLDPEGNAKAAELLRSLARHRKIVVTVTGEKAGRTVRVAAISIAK